jgi:hypothetical protein
VKAGTAFARSVFTGLVRVGAAGVNNTDINMRAGGQARSVALIDLAVFFQRLLAVIA